MLSYDMPLYRPPSEGRNLIIQATYGCSFNHCSFCNMYKSKEYAARPLEAVFKEIDQLARFYPEGSRLFLADGDALTLDTDHLLALLDRLAKAFPNLTRVSCYATPGNILKKSPEELQKLKAAKLSLLYVGVETGAPVLLKKITKGASQKGIIEALTKADENGLKVSATVILGLGGQTYWEEHVKETAYVFSNAPVNYLSTLQLYLEEEVYQEFMDKFGEPFIAQSDDAILAELEGMVAQITPPKPVIFRSNHASNALALAGNLPKDQARLLSEINQAKSGYGYLRPQELRGL